MASDVNLLPLPHQIMVGGLKFEANFRLGFDYRPVEFLPVRQPTVHCIGL